MSFLSPAFLWAFLSLIPLAAIYFLKVRPRKKSTTAYFLWEKIFSEKRATSLFNKLRDLLSLLLMLLAFCAVVLALAKPEFKGDERKDLLIIVDHSASMSARDGGVSRLDRAKDAARDIAIALNGNQRAAVATVAGDIEFRSHLSVSPRELIEAVDEIDTSDFPFDISSLKSLGADAHWSEDHRIILLSDGNFEDAGELPSNVELIKIGEPAENVGIVAADLQRLPDGTLGFYFRVASSYKENIKADLTLKNAEGERIWKLIPLDIEPGENKSEIFNLEADAPAGKWTAEIELEDSFAKDNFAYLAVPPRRPVGVRVDAKDRYFYETSVLSFERGSGLLRLVTENPEIVIEQGVASGSPELSVVFAPSGESPWWKSVGDVEDSVAPRILIEDHPVLRNLDLSGLVFIGAKKIEPADGSLILVESESGNPLIYRASRDGKTALVVNLDPVASEFYFSAWFPVLVHGAATHLAGREEELAPVYRPGDTAPVPGFQEGTASTLIKPNATPETEPAEITTGRAGPLTQLGFYEIESGGESWPVGISLMTPAESLLDNTAITETAKPVSRGQSPAYWLIVVALIILAAESILYHRRKVG